MGITAMDEILIQKIFIDQKPPPKKIHIPFIIYEINLFLLSWLGLFFLDEPRVILIIFGSIWKILCQGWIFSNPSISEIKAYV